MNTRFTILLCFCLFPAVALAQDNNFNVAAGDWNDPNSWDTVVIPPAGENAFINNGGVATLAADTNLVKDVGIGQGAGTSGTLNHSAGLLSVNEGWIRIGVGAPAASPTGIYNMSGTASLTSIHTNDDDARIFLGGANGEIGNGTLTMNDDSSIGIEGWMMMGNGDGSTAVLNVHDNASINAKAINMGGGSATNVTVNQDGGTVTSNNWIGIANFGGGTVNYNISGGSVISAADVFSVGEQGTGNLNVSGTARVEANGGGGMIIGRNNDPGTVGTLNVEGSNAFISVASLIVDNDDVAEGTISWTADAGGITSILSSSSTTFGDDAFLLLDLTADADFGLWGSSSTLLDSLLLIDNQSLVMGTFQGLGEGAFVDIGGGKTGQISYLGGADGFDVVVNVFAIPEPSSVAVISLGLAIVSLRRRRR